MIKEEMKNMTMQEAFDGPINNAENFNADGSITGTLMMDVWMPIHMMTQKNI